MHINIIELAGIELNSRELEKFFTQLRERSNHFKGEALRSICRGDVAGSKHKKGYQDSLHLRVIHHHFSFS